MLTLDQALPVVRDLAGRKASAFVRSRQLPIREREDVESHLVLNFITRWPKFDAERASVQTFASRLMDKELTSILRYRLAQCRQITEFPERHRCLRAESIHQFRIDLERAMAPLPNIVRETAFVLTWSSVVDAAAELGCSRQMINRRKHQIRDALIAAGINADYFVAGAPPGERRLIFDRPVRATR